MWPHILCNNQILRERTEKAGAELETELLRAIKNFANTYTITSTFQSILQNFSSSLAHVCIKTVTHLRNSSHCLLLGQRKGLNGYKMRRGHNEGTRARNHYLEQFAVWADVHQALSRGKSPRNLYYPHMPNKSWPSDHSSEKIQFKSQDNYNILNLTR